MLSTRRNNMTLSTNEQTQKDNFGSTKEFVRRLTISPLDTVWIADLEGSIQKRLVRCVDNHNTGVRKLDLIALPGEQLMITRRTRDMIDHVSRKVFKVGKKTIVEANNEGSGVFKKVDLSKSYYAELNTRLLHILVGEENLVITPMIHHAIAFSITDTIRSTVFQSHICYRTDGESMELIKPTDWSDSWDAEDNSVYIFIPFDNTSTIRVLMQDTSKHNEWMTTLAKRLESEGFYIDTQSGSTNYSFFSIGLVLPELLFNVK